MTKFIGREQEIRKILALKEKNTSSLVVITGRRRIGKSTLIDHTAKQFKKYISISGLSPRKNMNNHDQLRNFHSQLQTNFKTRKIPPFFDWYSALLELAQLTRNGEYLILLDEISWMGGYDLDFPGQVKTIWDQVFSKNNRLMLVLCGSVSSWIEENILINTDYAGRVSLHLNIEELKIRYCNEFWGSKKSLISSLEKLKILCITGGVPKYLSEILPSQSTEKNILRLCFSPDGALTFEYDKIFNEVFLKRNSLYSKIIHKIFEKKRTAAELAKSLKISYNGDFTQMLRNLELSGFIRKDFCYNLKGQAQGVPRFRLKDNYLRFYFQYIEPNKDKIQSKNFSFESVYQFSNWESTVGLLFENLILQNVDTLYSLLNIINADIIAASPYYQNKTSRTKGSCQIDLLVTTKDKTIFLCEFKVKEQLDSKIIQEMKSKIKRLQIPRGYSVRPVLVYEGNVGEKLKYELADFFHKIIPFESFFMNQ